VRLNGRHKVGCDLECDGGEQYFCSVVSRLSQMARMTQILLFNFGRAAGGAAVYIKSPTDEGQAYGKCTFY